jgi:hypothetical protein
MLTVVLVWLAMVGLVMTSYVLVWLLSPQLSAWMEAPRDQFLQQQRRFPRVVRKRPPLANRARLPSAPRQVQARAPGSAAAAGGHRLGLRHHEHGTGIAPAPGENATARG